MSGGTVLLSLMTFVFPVYTLIPIHGAIQLVSNSSRCFFLRSDVIRPIFLYFLLGLPFGTFLAIKIIKSLEGPGLALLLIFLLITYTLFRPKKLPELKIPYWGFTFVGLGVGVLGPLVGATGMFLAPFFLRDDFSKNQIIATNSSVQILGHLIKIPTFIYLGFSYMDHALIILLMSIATIMGTHYGVGLLRKMNERIFRKIFRAALAFAGLRILYMLIFSSY